MRLRILLTLGVFVSCLLLSLPASGEDTQVCMGCHGDKGIVKMMGRAGGPSLYVDQGQFRGSVHGPLGCSGCHQEISMEDHPGKRSKANRNPSNVCKTCHTASRGIHAALVDGKEGNPACTDCHGAHAVKTLKSTRGSEYCLKCHANAIYLALGDGAKLSLKVDQNNLVKSVHAKLTCSDCHFGFSSKEHPEKNFKSRRDFDIANSDGCRRCHFDVYTKTMESVHFTALSQGNLKAAVCTDCHGAHSIIPARETRALSLSICAKCHEGTRGSFAKSIHGVARMKGNQDAPTCLDCHGPHAISDPKSAAFHLRVPELCGRCHADGKLVAKYGISPAVVTTYRQEFHGITLGFYKQKGGTRHPAVCTDCHGIHDIAGLDQPNSPSHKAYLDRKCMACHPDAPAGFSASAIPHYQASLAIAPTVFAINLFYRLFIGIMVAGLLVQILLHIWRIISRGNKEENHGN